MLDELVKRGKTFGWTHKKVSRGRAPLNEIVLHFGILFTLKRTTMYLFDKRVVNFVTYFLYSKLNVKHRFSVVEGRMRKLPSRCEARSMDSAKSRSTLGKYQECLRVKLEGSSQKQPLPPVVVESEAASEGGSGSIEETAAAAAVPNGSGSALSPYLSTTAAPSVPTKFGIGPRGISST